MKQPAVLLLVVALTAAAVSAARDHELSPRQLRALRTSFSEHLEKTANGKEAKTAYDDEPHGYHDDYYKPVKTESICLREVYRRECVAVGASGPPTFAFSPAGRVQISDMGCCFEEAPAEAQADAKPSYYPGIDHHGDEYDDPSILPYSEGFLCNWQLTYAEQPVEVSPYVQRIGAAYATCYFNQTAEHCSHALKDGTVIQAKLDMFYVYAVAKQQWVPVGLDQPCNDTYGGVTIPTRTSAPDSLSGLKSKLKAKLKADGIPEPAELEGYGYGYDHPSYPDYHGPAGVPAFPVMAVVLAGPITSISNMRHATEYKEGVMQFVPVMVPTTMGPATGRPLVKPNSYKFVLAKGDY